MIALHAQGWENDTAWLNSKLKPYKFNNRTISEILGAEATENPKM